MRSPKIPVLSIDKMCLYYKISVFVNLYKDITVKNIYLQLIWVHIHAKVLVMSYELPSLSTQFYNSIGKIFKRKWTRNSHKLSIDELTQFYTGVIK